MADVVSFAHPQDPTTSLSVHLYGATGNAVSSDACTCANSASAVTSWKVRSKEQLWLSSSAVLNGTKAISIPLVFPQFGTVEGLKLPQHGFARCSRWRHVGSREDKSNQSKSLVFELLPEDVDPKLREFWPHAFGLIYTVTLGTNTLHINFTVKNPSPLSDINFTCLLHSYFNVNTLPNLRITGLDGITYTDKTQTLQTFKQSGDITIGGETDRVYINVPDASQGHEITFTDNIVNMSIRKEGFKDVVVWNPWIEKAKAMADYDNEGYKNMVCVEVGSVVTPVVVKPGEQWEAEQVLTAKM